MPEHQVTAVQLESLSEQAVDLDALLAAGGLDVVDTSDFDGDAAKERLGLAQAQLRAMGFDGDAGCCG